MKIDIAILTPVEIEYMAVRQHINDLEEIRKPEGLYEKGTFLSKEGEVSIVIQETGMLTANMTAATERIINLFNPKIIFLVGIAGGVKDVKIGDIVVAERVYGIESGKESASGFQVRPHIGLFNRQLLQIAKSVSRKSNWKKRALRTTKTTNIRQGAIASSDKLIATTETALYSFLKNNYNDTLAIEMEAIGFTDSLVQYDNVKNIKALCIRGISDLLDGKSKSDKAGGQEKASQNVAAFTFECIYELDSSLIQRESPVNKEQSKTPQPKPPRKALKREVEDFVKKGDIENALNTLNEAIGGDALLLLGGYERDKRQHTLRLISDEDWRTSCNKLSNSILEIVKELNF